MKITVDKTFTDKGFAVHLAALSYTVRVGKSPSGLIQSITEEGESRQTELMGDPVSSDPVIAALREAFKLCGKDPSRYRPSSEALLRRIMAGKGLYSVNNVVDAGNLISIGTGLPIGVYDSAKISGDCTLRLGGTGESYDWVGRGNINLEHLPVMADDHGPFGSPFSDSARTSISEDTTEVLLVLYGLNVSVELMEQMAEAADLIFEKYCTEDVTIN